MTERDEDPPREELVQPYPEVLEGEDDIPRQPVMPRDPFVPEPGPRPGEEKAFRALWVALIIVAIAVAITIFLALR